MIDLVLTCWILAARLHKWGRGSHARSAKKYPAVVKKIRGDESGLETDMNVEDEEMTYKRLCF